MFYDARFNMDVIICKMMTQRREH